MKTCPMCKITKEFSEFHRSSKAPDGCQGHCKECKRVLGRGYEKTRSKETRHKYGQSEWLKRKNDPEYLDRHREWMELNSERVKETAKRYREKNKIALLYTRSNQRCKEKGAMGTLTMKDWEDVLMLTNYMCIACEENSANSIDHVVPISRGGSNTKENIQPMCLRCNLKKGSRIVDFRNPEFIVAL